VRQLVLDVRRWMTLAWRQLATAERRVAWHLIIHGFLVRREPIFVSGRKADFLTFGRGKMWVEVKEFDPPVSQELLDMAWKELTVRLEKFTSKCRVEVWIAPGFSPHIAKQVVHLLNLELKSGLRQNETLYLAIPAGNFDRNAVRLEWRVRDGSNARMVALRSRDGVYGCPLAAEPASWISKVQVIDGTSTIQRPAFQILSQRIPSRAVLRVGPPISNSVLGSLSNAEAQDVTTIGRLRKVIDDANDQLKNSQSFRKIPGVLIVYFDHLGGGQHDDVLGACLGDLTVSIDTNTNQAVSSGYGNNGVFRPNKNTAVSAIIYRSRHYPPMSLINPYAAYPVEKAWLDKPIYSVDSTGAVRSD
jgi:hypothetical protein